MLRRLMKWLLISAVGGTAFLAALIWLAPWDGSWWKYPFNVALWWHLDVLGEEDVDVGELLPFEFVRVCRIHNGYDYPYDEELDRYFADLLKVKDYRASSRWLELIGDGGFGYLFFITKEERVVEIPMHRTGLFIWSVGKGYNECSEKGGSIGYQKESSNGLWLKLQ